MECVTVAKRTAFSEQIREAVDGSGLSRYRIAKLIGVSEVAVSKFMAGGGLSFDTLDRLAELLGLSVKVGSSTERKGQRREHGRETRKS